MSRLKTKNKVQTWILDTPNLCSQLLRNISATSMGPQCIVHNWKENELNANNTTKTKSDIWQIHKLHKFTQTSSPNGKNITKYNITKTDPHLTYYKTKHDV